MKIDIYNKQGKKTSKKVTVDDDVFKIEPNDHCIYLYLIFLTWKKICNCQGD